MCAMQCAQGKIVTTVQSKFTSLNLVYLKVEGDAIKNEMCTQTKPLWPRTIILSLQNDCGIAFSCGKMRIL